MERQMHLLFLAYFWEYFFKGLIGHLIYKQELEDC